jgi:2-dehydro-3-deoxyphosphooctonate aldolase (KDO 8-P synthase)
VAGFFMETHPDPAQAYSDKETQIPLEKMEGLLSTLKKFDTLAKEIAYQNIPNHTSAKVAA